MVQALKHSDRKAISLKGKSAFCSWSGGKDSCLSLYRAIQSGIKPERLLTMFTEGGERTRSHGIIREIIEAQAASLGIPLHTRQSSWSAYEEKFIDAACEIRKSDITHGIFGDIDIERHKSWEEKVCAAASIIPVLPLWQGQRSSLLHEFITAGFKALIVAVNDEKLPAKHLGRVLDQQLIDEFIETGIDPSGEEGEYHTVVVEGPILRNPLHLQAGKTVLRSGYRFLDYSLI